MIYSRKKFSLSNRFYLFCCLSIFFMNLLPYSSPATAAEDKDCLECHADPTLTKEVKGKQISLYVKPDLMAGTVHEGNGCVSCHVDADVTEFPHDSPLAKVDCGICHEDVVEIEKNSLHGLAAQRGDPDAPSCTECHGQHQIYNKKNVKSYTYVMNIPVTCGRCHREDTEMVRRHNISQKDIIKNYSMSIHGQGLYERGLIITAVCTSCHTAHNILPHTDPRSSINRNNIASTCMQCHAQIEFVHQRVIKGELWAKKPHVIPACVECHSSHQIRRVIYEEEYTDNYCLKCHHNLGITRNLPDGSIDSLYVSKPALEKSVHGEKNIACIKCHSNINRSNVPICRDSGPVDCSACHPEQDEFYKNGIHGELFHKNDPNAPSCTDCHGTHDMLSKTNTASVTFPRNIPGLCAKCHREGEKAAIRYQGKERQVISHYTMSIHGKGLIESGLMVSAVCNDCHQSHDILPSDNPVSSVNSLNVGKTCGSCHLGIWETFKNSIHSPMISHSKEKLPSCNNCHKSHEIERVDKDDFRTTILAQCGECHSEVTNTYFETYHGKVSKLGSIRAAKCSDCHGSHNILPTSNSASTLSRANIVATCKTCHPNSNRKFTGYLTHATHHNKDKYPILFYTFWAMTGLVIGVFLVFGTHTLLWIPRSFRERKRLDEHLKKESSGKYIIRFRLFPRVLHLMVIISFFGLAFTGMALKFSGFGWAAAIAKFFGGVEGAGTVHRICAAITFLYFGLHFYYMFQNAKREKKNFWKYMFSKEGMIPTWRDVKEFAQSITWFLGRKKAPEYGRWTYWEKFDYFAVFWGVAVIGSTGLVLWFPEFFTKFLPGILINVATIIHSDEALLATGFIFTIHFFNTHFRPQKFPMDPVIFTGKVPYEEWKNERPREHQMLIETGKLDAHISEEPPARRLVLLSRIFGYCCLTVGFIFVIIIIWAMLTQYK